jgi:hypothetical protein
MNHSNNSSDAPICNTTESSAKNTVNNMKDPAQKSLPTVMTFKDLHEPENLEQAKTSLKGKSGIYCFRHISSGAIYILVKLPPKGGVHRHRRWRSLGTFCAFITAH